MNDGAAVAATGNQLGPKGQRQRKVILQISRNILEESGLDGLVMRQVAAQADMKLGNLQYYFSTKEDLLEGLLREIYGEDTRTVLAGYPDGDFEGVFRHLLDNWETDIGRIYNTVFSGTGRHSRFRALKREIYGDFYELLVGLLRRSSLAAAEKELLKKAKLITSVLDGAVIQIHAKNSARASVELREFHDSILKILMYIVNE